MMEAWAKKEAWVKVLMLDVLQNVKDPETGVGVVELGLVHDLAFDEKTRQATVSMTLPSPLCPRGSAMLRAVRRNVLRCPGILDVKVRLTLGPV